MSITRCTDQNNSLYGFAVLDLTPEQKAIFVGKIKALVEDLGANGWAYGMGCKFVPLDASPPTARDESGRTVRLCDCSAFVRYALHHGMIAATGAAWDIPDGTWGEDDAVLHDTAQGVGFKRGGPTEYAAVCGLHDGVLRLCFCHNEDGQAYGHTWFDFDGSSYESHAPNGPSSRPADSSILTRIDDDYYCLC